MRCFWAILPPALLWGASFPLALARGRIAEQDGGKLVGEVYAANTVGAILGAVGFSIVLIPWVGTQDSQRGSDRARGAGGLRSLFVIACGIFRRMRDRCGACWRRMAVVVAGCRAVVARCRGWRSPMAAACCSRPTPGKRAVSWARAATPPIAISELPGGQLYFHVSGKVEASTEPYDMRLQRMLGHLPALIHPDPKIGADRRIRRGRHRRNVRGASRKSRTSPSAKSSR